MRKFRTLLAVIVMLPLVALGASLGDAELVPPDQVVPTDKSPAGLDQTAGYACCWVFFGGRWWCIPC